MTGAIQYLAREFEIDEPPYRYLIELIDERGNVAYRSKGESRDGAKAGLARAGVKLSDEAAPNAEYKEYLKASEPKLV